MVIRTLQYKCSSTNLRSLQEWSHPFLPVCRVWPASALQWETAQAKYSVWVGGIRTNDLPQVAWGVSYSRGPKNVPVVYCCGTVLVLLWYCANWQPKVRSNSISTTIVASSATIKSLGRLGSEASAMVLFWYWYWKRFFRGAAEEYISHISYEEAWSIWHTTARIEQPSNLPRVLLVVEYAYTI